jgi:hypothetical protein
VTQHNADRRLDRCQGGAKVVREASEKRVLDGIVVDVDALDGELLESADSDGRK